MSTTLSYKFKAIVSQDEINSYWLPMSNHYNECYNSFMRYIVDNICKLTFKDLTELISQNGVTGNDSTYIQTLSHELNSSLPLYRLFSKQPIPYNKTVEKEQYNKQISDKTVNNGMYEVFRILLKEKLKENVWCFNSSSIHREGCFKSLIGNLKSYFSNNKIKIKKQQISDSSTYEEKMDQLVYELIRDQSLNGGIEKWDEKIKLFKERGYSQKLIERFENLKRVYADNKDKITEYVDQLYIQQLQTKFNGSVRKSTTINIHSSHNKTELSPIEGEHNLLLKIYGSSGQKAIKLMGHRSVVNEDMSLNIDLSKRCTSLSFQFEQKPDSSYTMFVILQFDIENIAEQTVESTFDDPDFCDVKGCDINTKHAFMVTSMNDNGNIPGYVNILKEVLDNQDFRKGLGDLYTRRDSNGKTLVDGKGIVDSLISMSANVTFGIIESDLLHARSYKTDAMCQKHTEAKRLEELFTSILKKIGERYTNGAEKTYVYNVINLRNAISSYHILYNAFRYEKSKYEKEAFDSVENPYEVIGTIKGRDYYKGTKYINEHPFDNTEKGIQIQEKMCSVRNKIIGRRDAIIEYAYECMRKTGCGILSMENLDSSNFEKYQPGATTTSLLKKHKMLGMDYSKIEDCDAYTSHKNYYDVIQENGKVTDIQLTVEGNYEFDRALFSNRLIKAVNFASVKDAMLQQSTRRTMKIALVPAMYSSQMDAINHVMYTTVNKDGKTVFATKKMVRNGQERHLNGLNADVNSARNLEYIVKCERFRRLFLKPVTKIEYKSPVFKPGITSQVKFLSTIRKENLTEPIPSK